MTREQIETMGRLLDVEAGAGFTQKALARLEVINMIADGLRALEVAAAQQQESEIDG